MKTRRAQFFWWLAEQVEDVSIRLEFFSKWLRECMGDNSSVKPEAKREQAEFFERAPGGFR